MITLIMYAKVRRMYFREKVSINEIARRTSLSRNTIKKRKAGYDGSYARVTEFARKWREAGAADVGRHAFVPLKFQWGEEAFQFDWSEEPLVVGGVYRRLQVAHIKLCASRAFLLVAYPAQSHEMLFNAHARAFRALGGVPLRGIYGAT